MVYKLLWFICVVLQCGSLFANGKKQLVAMDRIILANIGKERLMNVHKFDIRLPPFRSGAGEGELDAAARDERKLWTKGVIPYIIHKTILDRSMFKTNLEKAIKEWKKYTCIKFRKKKSKDRDYVIFMYGVGCNADVGRKGGRQYVSLGRGCSDTSVIIHELGHVAGFWHEQNRPDRGRYVDIMWNNIIPDYRFAFDKYNKIRINSRNVTYDFKSIMHYGNYAFSSNRKATIVAKNSNVKDFGNIHLSPLDIKQANLVYNCPVKQTKFPKFPKDFKFSAQTIPGKHCVLLNEPKEKQQEPVYLCHNNTKKDAAISWSHAGKTTSLDCTHITSPYGEDRLGWWNDNYLCVANDSVYKFHWSENGPIAGLGCLGWPTKNESAGSKAFLCAKFFDGPIDGGWTAWSSWTRCNRVCGGGYQVQRRYCTNPVPKNYGKPCYGLDYNRRFCNVQKCSEPPIWPDDFMFKQFSHTPYDHNCVRVYERRAELTWKNYYFCSVGSKQRINMKWSDMGTQRGMRCLKVNEPQESSGWNDNYLCLPADSEYRFQWSHSGPIRGLACIKWFARNGSNGWNDNYLCGQQRQKVAAFAAVVKEAPPQATEDSSSTVAIHGAWSTWSSWSRCSKSCGQGYQRRNRTCNNPTPAKGGRPCPNGRMEAKRCLVTACPTSCHAVFTKNQGKLTSPQYPNYPQNSRCQWIIRMEKGKKIKVKFTYIRLKANRSRCSTDNIIVRNGENGKAPILKLFCSNKNSPVIVQSSGNVVTLQLRTSNNLRTGGFKAEWTSTNIRKEVPCGKLFTGNSGSFTSPLYPQKYPNKKECTWEIRVPLDRLLQVKFQDFNLEKHSKCSYDKVEIYDGGTLKSPKRTFCGDQNPGKV
ncbi:Zinc metallo ase nas-6 [Paramuricea clavata]|uniref:Metalloendopeptidase n=1 Tax=Paramuricea clavata TaxID=317549 RepID=A0A6S7H4J5_PARCT|nr:Zinc metallo ase nas-6 [Paramuricea clavata]